MKPRVDFISIDLNADIGEAESSEGLAIEEQILHSVTSVNIACGGHAGDRDSMRRTVRAALARGLAIGAHPSYPDRPGSGRTILPMEPEFLRDSVISQIAELASVAKSEGTVLRHCKPHGALYHAASSDEAVADVILCACIEIDPAMTLVAQAWSRAAAHWRRAGAVVCEEAFADRIYEADGSLRSRNQPGSVIDNPQLAAEQALHIANSQVVRCADGGTFTLRADSICIHSDTPNAAAVASRVAETLRDAGIQLRRHGG